MKKSVIAVLCFLFFLSGSAVASETSRNETVQETEISISKRGFKRRNFRKNRIRRLKRVIKRKSNKTGKIAKRVVKKQRKIHRLE